MNKIITTLFLLTLALTASANFTAQIDATQIQMGQTLNLTLTLDTIQTDKTPDLSALQENFIIRGTQRMVNYTLINGQAHSLNLWIILLQAKRAGVFTLPSIQLGNQKTKALQVTVIESKSPTSAQRASGTALKLLALLSDKTPYVNQQVIYTVKLYNNNRHRLLEANYQPPELKEALMVTLGGIRRYQVIENGVPYMVEELKYAFFPQKSGSMTINPPQFQALVFDEVPGNVLLKAKASSFTVQPVPQAIAEKDWLPAKKLSVTQSYDFPEDKINLGQMVVRTVTIKAVGVAAQLLPKLAFKTQGNFSVYPEEPIVDTQFKKSDLVGTVSTKVTYLFNKSGKQLIPELKLTWFNTTTGKSEVVTLPARSLTVVDLGIKPAIKPISPDSLGKTKISDVGKEASIQVAKAVNSLALSPNWIWALLLGLVLITLIIGSLGPIRNYLRQKRILAHARKKVRTACARNCPQAAKEALIAWARIVWPHRQFFNLGEVEKSVGEPLDKAIFNLSQQLYQREKKVWRGEDLWSCFLSIKPSSVRPQQKEKDALPPINP